MENNPFGSLHRDVLDATPDDDAGTIELEVMLAASHVITTYRPGKEKLINELKDRAKGAIAAKALPVADLLYSKAIEVHADATLYGNRSMVKLSLGHFKEALEDAEKSLSHDKTYGKAWFRKGELF
jgi:tetratricopeptide (TPR) repeat protein